MWGWFSSCKELLGSAASAHILAYVIFSSEISLWIYTHENVGNCHRIFDHKVPTEGLESHDSCLSHGHGIPGILSPRPAGSRRTLYLICPTAQLRAWEICRVRLEWGKASQPCVWAVRGYFGSKSGKECFVLFAPRDYQRWWSPALLSWTTSQLHVRDWVGREIDWYTSWQSEATQVKSPPLITVSLLTSSVWERRIDEGRKLWFWHGSLVPMSSTWLHVAIPSKPLSQLVAYSFYPFHSFAHLNYFS